MQAPTGDNKEPILQRLVAAIDWAGKRVGSITTSLAFYYDWLADEQDQRARQAFLHAFSDARVKQLKVVDIRHFYLRECSAPVAWLAAWLGGHTPCVEVLRVRAGDLSLDGFSLEWLKHLELNFRTLSLFTSLLARHLPKLETLHLHGGPSGPYVREIDVSECRHLRALSLRNVGVGKLSKPPTCRLAVVSSTAHDGSGRNEWGEIEHVLSLAEHVTKRLTAQEMRSSPQSIFQAHSPLKELRLIWPRSDLLSTGLWLLKCMPANNQPLFNLRQITITADAILDLVIPAKLPHLEELILASIGPLELEFKDPAATAGVLTTFCVCGMPLRVHGLHILNAAFQDRRKCLVAKEVGVPHSESPMTDHFTGGLCLRDIGAADTAIRQIEQLLRNPLGIVCAECKCGACFLCLKKAGCLDVSIDIPAFWL